MRKPMEDVGGVTYVLLLDPKGKSMWVMYHRSQDLLKAGWKEAPMWREKDHYLSGDYVYCPITHMEHLSVHESISTIEICPGCGAAVMEEVM